MIIHNFNYLFLIYTIFLQKILRLKDISKYKNQNEKLKLTINKSVTISFTVCFKGAPHFGTTP